MKEVYVLWVLAISRSELMTSRAAISRTRTRTRNEEGTEQ